MSVSKWAYTPEVCDGEGCPGDCDLCDKPKNMEDEDDMDDYIKRSDAARAMAQYMMDTALIDNPEASDRIEQWEGNIAAPIMSAVTSADVVEVVRCKDCKYHAEFSSKCNKLHLTPMRPNDYCSYGEREEE